MNLLGRLLVFETIRIAVKGSTLAPSGLAHALSDPELSPVLAQVCREPARPWTLQSLASEAVMSRSSFARRFRERMGMPVMEWIADLRMRQAHRLLADPSLGLEQVARQVGYASAASFSVAFKRWAGHVPSKDRGRSSPYNTSRITNRSEPEVV